MNFIEKLSHLFFIKITIIIFFTIVLNPKSPYAQTYLVDDYGAVGDGVTDDYNAIQTAVWDLRGTGGTLFFTSGKTYIISEGLTFNTFPATHNYLVTSTDAAKATIKLQDGAPLNWYHWGIRLSESRNVTIRNLVINGNRDTRNPTIEVSGTDVIFIDGASDGTRLENLDLVNSPMDNIYIVVHENSGETQMTDFEMHNCVLENAFRNNMSIISGENFKIISCEFNNANGTDPQSGIDFEPNNGSANGYKNMTVEGCKFKNNARYGIELTTVKTGDGASFIKNNFFENNGILIGSKDNEIHHNIFVNQDHQHLHTDVTRDGILYFHANGDGESNEVYNNYFYDNPMPTGSHLVNFMYNSGGNNHLYDNYGHGNDVAGFVLNNTWAGTPPQIISNNVFISRKEMGYWTMNNSEISGTNISDLSYFGNDGTLVNSPSSIAGKANEALDFSPDNKYVEIDTSNSLNIEMNITLSAWIKWNGTNANETEQVFLGRGDDWKFGINNSGQIGFYAPHSSDTSFTAGLIQADIADAIATNEWKFVTFTYDGATAKLFIDAEEVKSKMTYGVLGTSETKIYIGSKKENTFSFNGSIDEVKIHNYALEKDQIEKLKGVNYYVDFTGGNDSWNGMSPSTAFKTISKIDSMSFDVGDSILFKRGEVWKGTRLYIENIEGVPTTDIVYGTYGSGAKPIISSVIPQAHVWTGEGSNIWKATNPPAEHPERMLIDGVEKLRANIQGELDGINFFWRYNDTTNDLYIYSATDPNGVTKIEYSTDFPVIVGDSKYITIRDLDLQGGWTSIFINTSSQNITLVDMNIGKYAASGVVTNTDSTTPADYPKNIVIDNCNFDAFFAFDYSMAGTYQESFDRGCGDGIRSEALNTGEIKNCNFKNWGHASINLIGGQYMKVFDVKVHDNYLTSADICYGGRMAVDDAINNELYNNQIVNTSVQSQLNGQNNHYHHNIFKGTRDTPIVAGIVDAGVELQGYSESVVQQNIYENNLFINTEGPGFRISGNNDNEIHSNIIRNNIIYNCGTTISGKSLVVETDLYEPSSNNSFLNNTVYSSATTQTCDFRGTVYDVAGFNSQNGTDGYVIENNIPLNPLFVDTANSDYHLTGNSPCIDAGTAASSLSDYDKNPMPLMDKTDIGLYEYGIYWNGNICNFWSTSGNWSNNQVPDTADKVTIPSPDFYKHYPKLKVNAQIKDLFLNQNAKFELWKTLTLE